MIFSAAISVAAAARNDQQEERKQKGDRSGASHFHQT
jgi:hypothetical protein